MLLLIKSIFLIGFSLIVLPIFCFKQVSKAFLAIKIYKAAQSNNAALHSSEMCYLLLFSKYCNTLWTIVLKTVFLYTLLEIKTDQSMVSKPIIHCKYGKFEIEGVFQ